MDRNEIKEMYGIKDDALLDRTLKTYQEIDVPRLLSMAADGADALVEITKTAVDDAIAAHGEDTELVYPETGYGLPTIFAWKGIETVRLSKAKEILDSFGPSAASSIEDGLAAGEKAMYAADILEAVAYLNGKGEGFIPDSVLRGLGLSFVDETIPGAFLFLGGHVSGDDVKTMIRTVQGKI